MGRRERTLGKREFQFELINEQSELHLY